MVDAARSNPRNPISRVELVSLLAMLTATVAFSIDAMLPALPDIGAALSPDAPNKAQLVIASFLLGLGGGTFFAGPLCDAFGRKTIAVMGGLVYTSAALLAALSSNLELLLAARFVQGIGASGPRIATMAIVRDLFSGRQMAQMMSYIIFVFSLTPIIAPSLGWGIAWAFGWRAIFLSFAVFSAISRTWLILRQPETLRPENQRPFRVSKILEGVREVVSNGQVMLATCIQTLIFGALFASLMSSQQVFDQVLDRGDEFPLWFGLMAILSASSNLINARVVMRLGMRGVVKRALLAHAAGSALFLMLQFSGVLNGNVLFVVTFIWMTSVFFLASFGIGNMNALALEPLGHMAGLAASIVTAFATIGSMVVAVPIGLAFDGTLRPLTLGLLVLVGTAYLLLRQLRDDPAST